MRNTILFTIILFIAVIAASLFYFRSLDHSRNQAAKPLQHLPDNAILIVALHNNEVSDNIFKDFDIFDALLGHEEIQLLGQFKNQLLRADEIGSFFQDTEIYISFHPTAKGTETIFTIPTSTAIPAEVFPTLLQHIPQKYKISSIDTLGQTIYNINYGARDSILHVLYYQNILFSSFSQSLLLQIADKSTRHLPEEQIDFFIENSSRNTPLSVYFPHQQYDRIVDHYQRRSSGTFLDLFKNMQGQSAWNINFKQDALMLTGESELDQYSENYVSLFKNQQKTAQSLYNYFPANTAVYMEYSISDRPKFQKDLRDLFKRRKEAIAQEVDTTQLGRQLDLLLGNAFACIETANQNTIGFIQLTDTVTWKDFAQTYLEKTNDTIFRFKTSDLLYKKLGDVFQPFQRPYLTVIGDVLILANSSNILKAYRDDWNRKNLLIGTLGFKNFEKLQSYEANVTLFIHSKNAQQKIVNALTRPFQDNYKNTTNYGFSDFYSWSVQLSGNDGKFTSQLYAVYKSKSALGVTPEWTYSLDNKAITAPYVFEHSDTSQFILLQELDHTVHAIHPTGTKMWSTVFSGRVVGEIQQLEDRSILLVTDKNRLYRFDTAGEPLPGFSLGLSEEPIATPTLATFDSKKIILVPTAKSVLAFDLNGKALKDGSFFETTDRLVGPIVQAGKLLAIASTSGKIYYINFEGKIQREVVIPGMATQNPLAVYNLSGQPAVLATDTMHNVYRIDPESTPVAQSFESNSQDYRVDFQPLTGGQEPEMIVLGDSRLQVFTIGDDIKSRFEYNFTKNITEQPQYFPSTATKNQTVLGVGSKATNLIYLFEEDGSVMDGFPVEGLPLFYYGRINYNSGNYLLTMRRDHKLYAFRHQK
ncbi:hypothetical protein G5B30_01600 [Sphingobacterium sp. SGG-5]|uniref:hypothetical protein n=1 Tax=Sphingobacterium sp. SGG-5 TaxID=2710881 RepID=UPI0013ED7A51|nr:hypothetical protein [Sphingobacterium sp. SGG-5]NGM60600.1 hypothetical protein [Sphingobacterium sp. SGG-5]